jgi:hypothetical protein
MATSSPKHSAFPARTLGSIHLSQQLQAQRDAEKSASPDPAPLGPVMIHGRNNSPMPTPPPRRQQNQEQPEMLRAQSTGCLAIPDSSPEAPNAVATPFRLKPVSPQQQQQQQQQPQSFLQLPSAPPVEADETLNTQRSLMPSRRAPAPPQPAASSSSYRGLAWPASPDTEQKESGAPPFTVILSAPSSFAPSATLPSVLEYGTMERSQTASANEATEDPTHLQHPLDHHYATEEESEEATSVRAQLEVERRRMYSTSMPSRSGNKPR